MLEYVLSMFSSYSSPSPPLSLPDSFSLSYQLKLYGNDNIKLLAAYQSNPRPAWPVHRGNFITLVNFEHFVVETDS